MKNDLIDSVLNEKLNYGGFAMTRAEVYHDCIAQGFGPNAADYIAFSRKAISEEEASTLMQDGAAFFANERLKEAIEKSKYQAEIDRKAMTPIYKDFGLEYPS